MKKIVILDLDGTVFDCSHRLHFIEGQSRDYKAFYDGIVDDTPIPHIVDLVRALAFSQEYLILVVTGRPITHLRETQMKLQEEFISYHAIFMRPEGDFRKDYIVKKEILDTIRKEFGEPAFALDDRASVVAMWRENGVPCLQVAPGDFDKKTTKYKPGKLVLLVGPSGAGKSTHVKTYAYQSGIDIKSWEPNQVISTDELRREICDGDFQDQSKNRQVFATLYALVKARIEGGLLTVVDATNHRSADRKALRDLTPSNTEIEYHVIDRPLKEKLKTGGWRLTVENKGMGLIERHDQIFNSNLKHILAGDDDPRVTVKDFRKI